MNRLSGELSKAVNRTLGITDVKRIQRKGPIQFNMSMSVIKKVKLFIFVFSR